MSKSSFGFSWSKAPVVFGSSTTTKTHHSSFLGGLLGNLGSDAASFVENLPTGLYHLATTNPEDTAKAIWGDYSERYFSGHFLHNLYTHPLSFLLDAATLASLGGAGAAKLGVSAGEANIARSATALARDLKPAEALDEGLAVTTRRSTNPVLQFRNRATHNAIVKLPKVGPAYEQFRFNHDFAGAADFAKSKMIHGEDRVFNRYMQRYGRLANDFERSAFALHAMGVHPHEYATMLTRRKESGVVPEAELGALNKNLDLARHDSTLEHYNRNSTAFKEARVLGKKLGDYQADILKLDPAMRDESRFTPALLATTNEWLPLAHEYGTLDVTRNTHREFTLGPKDRFAEVLTPSAPKKNKAAKNINPGQGLRPAVEGERVASYVEGPMQYEFRSGPMPNPGNLPPEQLAKLQAMRDQMELLKAPVGPGTKRGQLPKANIGGHFGEDVSGAIHDVVKAGQPSKKQAQRQAMRSGFEQITAEKHAGRILKVQKRFADGHVQGQLLNRDGSLTPVTLHESFLHGLSHDVLRQRPQFQQFAKAALDKRFKDLGRHQGSLVRILGDVKNQPGKQRVEILRPNGERVEKTVLQRHLRAVRGDSVTAARKVRAIMNLLDTNPQSGFLEAKHMERVPLKLQGGTHTIEDLKREVEAGKRPDPFYFPQNMVDEAAGSARPFMQTFGIPMHEVHHNRGLLMTLGLMALNHDTLGPQFYKTVLKATQIDTHTRLLKAAHKIQPSELSHWLSKGYVRVRSEEEISNPKFVEAHLKQFHETFDQGWEKGDWSRLTSKVRDELTAKDVPNSPHGELYVVDKKLVDRLLKEHRDRHHLVEGLIKRPLTWWKRIILGGRPAFLANNTFGNAFMLSLHMGGPTLIRSMLHAMVDRPGGEMELASLSKSLGRGKYQGIRDRYMPELHNTFAAGHSGDKFVKSKGERVLEGVMPAVSHIEDKFRLAGMETALRKNATVKAMMAKAPTGVDKLEWAAHRLFEGGKNERLRRDILTEVERPLGNYRSYGPLEQTARELMPFYAWYRHAALSGLDLGLNKPGRVNALAQVGNEGQQDKLPLGLPDFLQQLVPLGQGGEKLAGLSTQGLNPYNTDVDLARGLHDLLPGGNPKEAGRDVGGLLHPGLSAAIQGMTGVSLLTGAPLKQGIDQNQGGLLGSVLSQTFGNVPQAQLLGKLQDALVGTGAPTVELTPTGRVKKKKTPLYNTDLLSLLESYLGVPLKNINLSEAQTLAQKGG